MSDGKKVILQRIREALQGVPEDEIPGQVEVPREYEKSGELSGDRIVSLFAERTGEYKADIRRIKKADLQPAISTACSGQEVQKLVVPPGFPEEWLPGRLELLRDNPEQPLTNDELDRSDGVVTTCALAVAQTGTIVLDASEGQGRRALTLLPDYHLCIVEEDQIVERVPEAFDHFEEPVKRDGRPITFISGPSATSDIELNRVEGVHGPRRLEVLIVSG
ncbi:MAG: lactate utilization protein C [Balneolaceae bacterium]|nr:lactate utilization protein C [Balneolaceae bacterium]